MYFAIPNLPLLPESLAVQHPLGRAVVLAGAGLAAMMVGRKLHRWSEVLLLRLLCGGSDKALYKEKLELFQHRLADLAAELGGGRPLRVLELGAGTGVNFKYLPPGTELTALDPLSEAHGFYARAASKEASIRLVAWVTGFAEDLSRFSDNSFDAVVCSLTLCSVRNVSQVVAEVRRVLRPGGLFLYIDHTLSNRPLVSFLQYAISPLWYILFHGCLPCRLPQRQVAAAGFSQYGCVEYDGKLITPLLRRMARGWAVK